MSAASISIAVNGGAAANITDGATTYILAGASVVLALQTSTGIKRWIIRADNPVGGSDPQGSLSAFQYQADSGGTFSTTIAWPRNTQAVSFISETLDANNNFVRAKITVAAFQGTGGASQYHKAAVANTTNVNTAAMNVVIDGVTLIAGQAVLLVNQTTGSQNGLYSCGTVTANLCALTRVDIAGGEVTVSPIIVEVEAGTLYGGSTWKTTNTGSLTMDTTSLTFYPRTVRGTANLASNTVNVTNLWIVTGATALAVATNLNVGANVSTTNAGAGTGNIIIQGANAGGTGSYAYCVVNWG